MQKWMVWIVASVMFLSVAGCSTPAQKVVEVPVEKIVEKIVEKPVDERAIVLAAVDKALSSLPADYAQIAPDKLQERIAQQANLVIVDVRTVAEVEKMGKIAGAVVIPIVELGKKVGTLPTDLNASIATVCAVGVRGTMAMITLKTLGYTNVVNLKGGFTAWTAANLPIAQ